MDCQGNRQRRAFLPPGPRAKPGVREETHKITELGLWPVLFSRHAKTSRNRSAQVAVGRGKRESDGVTSIS